MKFFRHFFRRKRAAAPLLSSEARRLSWRRRLLHCAVLWGGGSALAAAFPPFNCTLLLFLALAVLLLEARNRSWWRAALAGWLWGMGYAFWSFLWLREIHPAIPWFMMVVLGGYYAPVGWAAAVLNRWLLLPEKIRAAGFSAQTGFRDFSVWRQLAWCTGVAATVVLVEYLRHAVLPWNYFGAGFWRNGVMLQLTRWTGIYGLSFLACFVNAAAALAVLTVARRTPDGELRYRRPWPLLIGVGLLAGVMVFGVRSFRERQREYAANSRLVRLTLVQGNLSQRRFGGEDSAREALNAYTRLSLTQQGVPTDLVVWPETAINYPLRGSAEVCGEYRTQVRKLSEIFNVPLLVGTLEYDLSTVPPGLLNSAVLLDDRDMVRYGYRGMYSKVHPVPFGEFIPLRRYLPGWLIELIDMRRDLTPGTSLAPLELDSSVRLGINICFEDVFAYIARGEFWRGANLLLVITNDAWYPTSSEPEQHLANAIPRAVETNLPMVRCGNDSASCVISPAGQIIWSMAEALKFGDGTPAARGAGAATVTVRVTDPAQLRPTFYTCYGDWWVGVCAILLALELAAAWRRKLTCGC